LGAISRCGSRAIGAVDSSNEARFGRDSAPPAQAAIPIELPRFGFRQLSGNPSPLPPSWMAGTNPARTAMVRLKGLDCWNVAAFDGPHLEAQNTSGRRNTP